MHMYEHETPPTSLVILISVFQSTSIWSIPKPFNIPLSKEKFVFFVSLVISVMIVAKFLIKHL